MAQRERYALAENREERAVATREVPDDWFLDPADPNAGARYNTSMDLEDAATAFLADHSAKTQELDSSNVTPMPSETTSVLDATNLVEEVERPKENAEPKQRVSLAEFMGLDDEGELGWQTQALCAQTDPEAFFPEKGGSTRDAKKVCGSCAVRTQCLEYALKNDERFGIWGGMSERERRRLRKQGF